MIAHVVLFRPRADLSENERRALVEAWRTALADIPVIRRAHVGRRIRLGRSYEDLTRIDLPYAAVLEFDSADGVRAYLDHPAHVAVAARLFDAIADALIYDFEMEANVDALGTLG